METATLPALNVNFAGSAAVQKIINEDLMYQRHTRLRSKSELVFEFTKDPAYLHQYYVLRSMVFKRTHGLDIAPAEDASDRESDIFIVRQGNQVVGGVRMQVVEPGAHDATTMQQYGVDPALLLPELKVNEHRYCEFSRMVVLEEYQNKGVVDKVFQSISDYATRHQIDYCFVMSISVILRIYQRAFKKIGLPTHCLTRIEVPRAEQEAGGRNFGLMVVCRDASQEDASKLFAASKVGMAAKEDA